jgi:hypothetical protein
LEVLIQVIRYWQVLSVTVVLLVYFSIVLSAARGRKRPRSMARTTNVVKTKDRLPAGEPDMETPEGNDLGLTEE